MINSVIQSGILGKAIELNSTTTGKYVTTFTIAINKPTKDNTEKTEWFKWRAWDKVAERVAKAQTGDTLILKGYEAFDEYVNKDGIEVKQVVNIAQEVYIQRKGATKPAESTTQQVPYETFDDTIFMQDDENLPF